MKLPFVGATGEFNMLKVRSIALALGVSLSSIGSAQVHFSVGIGLPNVSIGINIPAYPHMVLVPGYPVYYAPHVHLNLFFYDGLYWVYQNDHWYVSSWFNGPWGIVGPHHVPVFILRVPVRYYRQPPAYFTGWHMDGTPRWGDHWGRDWSRSRSGWDHWDRRATPRPAALPDYQRQYSDDRYPKQLDQQNDLHQRYYGYRPRDPVVQKIYQEERSAQRSQGRSEGPAQMDGRGNGGPKSQAMRSQPTQPPADDRQQNRKRDKPTKDE